MKWLRFQIWWHTACRISRWNEKAQMAIAWRLPRWLMKWAVVRAYAGAWEKAGDKTPDELTYGEVYEAALGK